MKSRIACSLLIIGLVALPQLALATPSNLPPPAGPIFDPNGQLLPTRVWTQYSVNFVATLSNTDVTLAFRNDPGWTQVDDISVTLMGGGPQLLTNGGFETGDLTGWTYDNVYGAAFGGSVTGATCAGDSGQGTHSGSFQWCDGATQAYDAIDQFVATTIGQTYTISFWSTQFDQTGVNARVYSDLSTNGNVTDTGGNGVDTLVYVGATIPAPVPEPSSILMFGSGLVGVAGMIRRKINR